MGDVAPADYWLFVVVFDNWVKTKGQGREGPYLTSHKRSCDLWLFGHKKEEGSA
jgi:hypothetical protein